MASVVVYSTAQMDALLSSGIVGAAITSGNLILTKRDGTNVNAGAVLASLPDASSTAKGAVELATDTETIAGTDSSRAVTPFGLAATVATATAKGIVELATTAEATTGTDTVRAVTPAGLKAVADTKQPADSDLTTIAALAKTNDNIMQVKSGAWTERTMAQLATDLVATGEFPDILLHNGTAYVDVDGPDVYIGPTDPGAVANGCIWFDTTGA